MMQVNKFRIEPQAGFLKMLSMLKEPDVNAGVCVLLSAVSGLGSGGKKR